MIKIKNAKQKFHSQVRATSLYHNVWNGSAASTVGDLLDPRGSLSLAYLLSNRWSN